MNITYAMHVNWQWIRQRPQALAEQLALQHRVQVLHARMFHRQHRASGPRPRLVTTELQRLPGRALSLPAPLGPALRWANQRWLAQQIAAAARQQRADLLWLTHPDFAHAAQRLPHLPVVYDCMDDHAAFENTDGAAVLAAERQLLARADLVFFSSATLARRVRARADVGRHEIINNGVDAAMLRPTIATAADSPRRVLGYFGSIARWFDWPLVLRVLDALPQATLRLAGPLETALPQHPRIEHVGVLAHDRLGAFADGCDWLLMPFAMSPLIEAVDPVKLYEYLALGRPALAPRYAESERFAPWVTLYDNAETAIAALRAPLPARDDDGVQRFLAQQTWQQRGTRVAQAIESLTAATSARDAAARRSVVSP